MYNEITNKYNNIIVMENIEGLKIKDIKNFSHYDKNEFGKLLVKFGIISLLFNSAIHNDLHSGNIFFYLNSKNSKKPKYQIGIIDFGICIFPNRENQYIYYKFFYEILINNNFDNIEEVIKNIINEKEHFETFNDKLKLQIKMELIKIFKIYLNKDLDHNLIISISKIFKKYKLTYTREINQLFFGLLSINMLCKELCNNFNETQIEILNNLSKINSLIEVLEL